MFENLINKTIIVKRIIATINAIGGIIFGVLSAIVGIYMIIYTIYMKSKDKIGY